MADFQWNDGSGQSVTVTPITSTSDQTVTISSPQNPLPTVRSIKLEASLDGYNKSATINVTQAPIGLGDMKLGSTFIVYPSNSAQTAQLLSTLNAQADASNSATKVSTFNKIKTWLKRQLR